MLDLANSQQGYTRILDQPARLRFTTFPAIYIESIIRNFVSGGTRVRVYECTSVRVYECTSVLVYECTSVGRATGLATCLVYFARVSNRIYTNILDIITQHPHIEGMTEPDKPVPFMNAHTFATCVQNYASVHHMVGFTDHAQDQMKGRDVTRRMVLRVLEKGSLAKGPTWNADYGTWEGKMQGVAAGSMVSVVCAITDGQMTVTVVTVHRGGR